MSQIRNHQLDNLRAFLIFLVVLGHLSEVTSYQGATFLREFVYLIHMPGLVLLSGFFWHGRTGTQLLKNLVYPYIVFQTAYLVFDCFILGNVFTLQYTRPYWTLWYLVSLMTWKVFASVLPLKSFGGCLASFLCSSLASVLIGFDNGAGYSVSLSRSIVFFPFFLCGTLLQNYRNRVHKHIFLSQRWKKIVASIVLALTAGIMWIVQDSLKIDWLYHALSYEKSGCPVFVRIAALLAAYPILYAVYVWTPNRELPVISRIGRNTLTVFLLHGFITRWIGKLRLLNIFFSTEIRGVAVIALSAGIVLLLSMPAVVSSVRWLVCWPFSARHFSETQDFDNYRIGDDVGK